MGLLNVINKAGGIGLTAYSWLVVFIAAALVVYALVFTFTSRGKERQGTVTVRRVWLATGVVVAVAIMFRWMARQTGDLGRDLRVGAVAGVGLGMLG